ncbi:DMT family transporter, partial [filamentous cyanobacterium LEGE 11480]
MNQIFAKISGRAYLLVAIVIFGLSNAITRKLTDLGATNLIDGRNPISFCNLLFVGNLVALLALLAIYGRQWKFRTLTQLSKFDWLALVLVATLSGALAPALIFAALEQTAVNNVVLIGRVEPPLALALSVIFLRERVNLWVILGVLLSFIGVALTVLIQPSGMMGAVSMIGRGELMTLSGAVALAVSSVISKHTLSKVPLGVFSIFRMLMGTVIFFAIVVRLFGPGHFMDVFSPFLWQWMLLYSLLIVVGGQLFWFQGLKKASAGEVSLISSFGPIVGILAALLILGEVPTMAQYIGGSIILLGVLLNQIGVAKQRQ